MKSLKENFWRILAIFGIMGCGLIALALGVLGLFAFVLGSHSTGLALLLAGAIVTGLTNVALQLEHRPVKGVALVRVPGVPDADPQNMATWYTTVLKVLGADKLPFRFGYVTWMQSISDLEFRALIGRHDAIFVAEGVGDLRLVTVTRGDDPQHQELMAQPAG